MITKTKNSIFHSRSGIPGALISTPLRYMHSPAELVSLEDVESVAGLMTEFVLALKGDEEFKGCSKTGQYSIPASLS